MVEPSPSRRGRSRPESSFEETDRRAFIDAIPLRAQAIIEAPDFLPSVRKHIDKFRKAIESSEVYNTQDKKLITRALDLAIVAYQDNDKVDLRTRKRTVRHGGQDVPLPYIEHPVSVAMAMIGEPRKIRLLIDAEKKENVTLNVKQDAYKAEVVASALLHDVIEDSKLTLPSKKESIEGKDKWSSFIRQYFAGNNPDAVNSIATVVNAVTKYDVVPSYVSTAIEDSDVFITVMNQLYGQGVDKDYDTIRNQVVRSLSDLHKMLEISFGTEGNLHFDDASFSNFYAALAVKCHDIENNLEDGGVRDDKLVRAHIYATFARIYGLPVASRIVAHLVTATNYDMYWGTGSTTELKKEAKKTVRIYTHREDLKSKPFFKVDGRDLQVTDFHMPILSEAEIEGTANFRPVLQYKMVIKNDMAFLKRIEEWFHETEHSLLPVKVGGRDFVGVPILQETQSRILECGRLCYYFNIYRATDDGAIDPEHPDLIGIYRIQDDQPNAHDILKAGSSSKRLTDPERKMISKKYKGTPKSSMKVCAVVGSEDIAA